MMTNTQWIDLLTAEWQVSRTVAREMIHKMMEIKRRDTEAKAWQAERRMR